MQPQNVPVISIVPGYAFTADVNFQAANGSPAPGLTDLTIADQIIGSVKRNVSDADPPLVTLVVVAISPTQVAFTMTALQTAALTGLGVVLLDFARLDGTEWSPLPAVVQWPIRDAVTFQ